MPHESISTKLTLVKGASKTYLLVVSDENGNVDLTNHKLFFTVKREASDGSAVISKDSDTVTQISKLTPQADADKKGKAQIFLQPSDTAGLDVTEEYVADAWIELDTGARHQIVPNRAVEVSQPVTVIP